MTERYPAWQAIATCIFAILLTPGCAGNEKPAPVDVEQQAFEDLREAVRDAVEDETREAEAIRLVGQLEDDLAALRVQIADRKNTIRKLNADYDTPRSDFEAHLERVGTEVRENRQRVSSTQAALKGVITAEENEAISKAHTKAMQAAIVSIQTT